MAIINMANISNIIYGTNMFAYSNVAPIPYQFTFRHLENGCNMFLNTRIRSRSADWTFLNGDLWYSLSNAYQMFANTAVYRSSINSPSGYLMLGGDLNLCNLKDARRMFYNVWQLWGNVNISNLNNVEHCEEMFTSAGKHVFADNGFNVKIKNTVAKLPLSNMFQFSALNSIQFLNSDITLEGDLNFRGLDCLNRVELNGLNTTNATVISFNGCKQLSYINCKGCDFSNVVNGYAMFANCSNLVNVFNMDGANWAISNLSWAFYNSGVYDNIFNIVRGWNFDNVINMSAMFGGCQNLGGINLNNCRTISSMFSGSRVEHLNVHNIYAPETSFGSMFASLKYIRDITLSDVNICDVNLSSYSTQQGIINYLGINTYTSNIAREFNLSIKNFHLPINNDGNYLGLQSGLTFVKNLEIDNCFSNSGVTLSKAYCWLGSSYTMMNSLTICNMDVSNAPNIEKLSIMERLYNLNTANIHDINIRGFKTIQMLISGCQNLSCVNLSNLYFESIEDISDVLAATKSGDCIFSNWNLPNAQNILVFCGSYVDLNHLIVNNWNLCNVNSIVNPLFTSTSNINTAEFKNIDLNSVTDISNMFRDSKYVVNIHIDNWYLTNLQVSTDVFYNCQSVRSINMYNFHSPNLTNTYNMFCNCFNLCNLDLSGLQAENLVNISSMFTECNNLSDASIDSIINLCVNAVNVGIKNLSVENTYSPFYNSNISNMRYENRWSELTEAGWTY